MTPERVATIKQCLNRRQPDLTVIMENVCKPHNLAAVARTLEAVGGMEIHAISQLRSLRLTQMSAAGVRKWVQVIKHKDVATGVTELKTRGFHIVATSLGNNAVDYREIDYTQPVAILVGEEYDGLSEQAIAMADTHITIPMAGMVQSLNVSVAAALVLYEALRQREAAGHYNQHKLDEETYTRLLFEAVHPDIAKYCKQKSVPYPAMDEDCNIIEAFEGSTSLDETGYSEWIRKAGS